MRVRELHVRLAHPLEDPLSVRVEVLLDAQLANRLSLQATTTEVRLVVRPKGLLIIVK